MELALAIEAFDGAADGDGANVVEGDGSVVCLRNDWGIDLRFPGQAYSDDRIDWIRGLGRDRDLDAVVFLSNGQAFGRIRQEGGSPAGVWRPRS